MGCVGCVRVYVSKNQTMTTLFDLDPYGWETDSDPEDDPGFVKLMTRIAEHHKEDPAALPRSEFKRLYNPTTSFMSTRQMDLSD